MSEDSVLQEVRAAREAYAQAHGFDVHAIVADLREQDARGDWPVVRLAPRRPVVAVLPETGPQPSLWRTPAAGGTRPDL